MSKQRINLTNRVFGHLKVVSKSPKSPKHGISRWTCLCDCGNTKDAVLYTSLVRGESKSCGACKLIPKGPTPVAKDTQIQKPGKRACRRFGDQTGKVYGRWTILSKSPQGPKYYNARCACGTTKVIDLYSAVAGTTTSCGCYRNEVRSESNRIYPFASEPHLQHTAHNPLYAIWLGIKTRCFNQNHPTFKRYGMRGITMHPAWKISFRQFATYIGPRPSPDHSIERIDNNGDYAPGNVCWATRVEQMANTRINPEVSYQGRTIRLRDLADSLKLDRSILRFQYLTKNLSLEAAIEKARMIQSRATHAVFTNPTPSVHKPSTSFIDHTGEKVAGYTVLEYQGRKHRTAPSQWLCRCDTCGASKIVLQTAIKRGSVRPCSHVKRKPKHPDDFC